MNGNHGLSGLKRLQRLSARVLLACICAIVVALAIGAVAGKAVAHVLLIFASVGILGSVVAVFICRVPRRRKGATNAIR